VIPSAIIAARRKESALVYGYQFVNGRFFLRFCDYCSSDWIIPALLNDIKIENYFVIFLIYTL
jgi:hypothetical protein